MTDPLSAPPPPSLTRFVDAFVPMLEQRRTAAEVESIVGASASGTHQLRFYRVLAERARFIVIRDVFPGLRHLARSLGVWGDLVHDFFAAHPPSDADPQVAGAQLSEFIEGWRSADLPSSLEEVADFEYCSWTVGVDLFEPTADDPGLDRTLFVRHYEHDVPRFVGAVHADGDAAPSAPEPKGTAVVIHRHPRDLFPRTFFPSPLGMLALARRLGHPVEVPAGVPPEALENAYRELEEHGVVPPRDA